LPTVVWSIVWLISCLWIVWLIVWGLAWFIETLMHCLIGQPLVFHVDVCGNWVCIRLGLSLIDWLVDRTAFSLFPWLLFENSIRPLSPPSFDTILGTFVDAELH
jgi:hypothetical protein